MRRRRYLISWTYNDQTGREFWVMERSGKISSADIKKMEFDIGKKWGIGDGVIITNYIQVN